MCGRYAFLLPPEAMTALFNLLNRAEDYPPRYNITPTQPIIAISEREGRRTADLFRWGFVPGWVKDPKEFPLLINARAESMLDKPSFRDAVRNSRCVIPASGYYEWMKGADGARRPYYITSTETETMAFAGLYATWAGPNGEEIDTICIVTVDPNLEISGVYDRMPAILRGQDAIDAWLNTRDVEGRYAAELAVSAPQGTMQYHAVGKAIGKATSEGPELIEPAPAEEAGPEKPRRKKADSGQLDLF
ncbi:MAG: SOS response-associated peptidase [Hyphomicrobiales bacterium]|nr:MAG: SOS response-associated peptidase [Hyphomicrobiales bacterium]